MNIARYGSKRGGSSYRPPLPVAIGRLIPDDQEFKIVLDEQGLHYIRIGPEEPKYQYEVDDTASWIQR